MALQNTIKENEDEIIIIGAHSNTGDKAYNFQLAKARATAVANFLSGRGIPFSRMSVIGSRTLDKDSQGESERWRTVSVLFTADKRRYR